MFVIMLICLGIIIFLLLKAGGFITEPESCGYCGDSANPNDICSDCWKDME